MAVRTPACGPAFAHPTDLRSAWAWGPPAVGLLLAALVLVMGANRTLFLALNRAGEVLGEGVWLRLTLLGDGGVALALLLPCIRRAPRVFWAGILAALFAVAWIQGVKHVVDLPRPLMVYAQGEFHHAGPALRHGAFPSGHAAAAFGLAGIGVMTLRARTPRILLLALATLSALSRIMLGVHWPIDVLGGMLVGWSSAWGGLALAARRHWRTQGWPAIGIGLLLLALCAALFVSRHAGVPAIMPLQRLLAGVCLVLGAWDVALLWARRDRGGQADG